MQLPGGTEGPELSLLLILSKGSSFVMFAGISLGKDLLLQKKSPLSLGVPWPHSLQFCLLFPTGKCQKKLHCLDPAFPGTQSCPWALLLLFAGAPLFPPLLWGSLGWAAASSVLLNVLETEKPLSVPEINRLFSKEMIHKL